MHAVSKIDPAAAQTPQLYQPHSTGFRRATYVDRAMGSVHMGTGICFLDAGGVVQFAPAFVRGELLHSGRQRRSANREIRRIRSAPAISD